MCGIAGFCGRKSENETKELIKKMVDATKWRGPDGVGVYIDGFNDSIVSLGHRRLSILDLSELGNQPLVSRDGRFVITYNGELYNYKEIKNELKQKGYKFISRCDTEVVLYSCVEWGIKRAVLKFNGMFSFAFYDKEKGIITLVRDRIGVKPLYYTKSNGIFAFSSDIKSLYCIKEIKKHIDTEALHFYLWNMYIPVPKTIYKEIRKLRSGCILTYEIKTSSYKIEQYWNPYSIEQTFRGGYGDYLRELRWKLSDAINLRLLADVPIGLFLSGGIDSSVICALAQEQQERPLNTFSIGFEEKANDDAEAAKEVSNILGTKHTELYCSQKDALNMMQKLSSVYAEPFADNSQIPMMLLSELTKNYVTVSLSGDGGDEFFVGYPNYVTQNRLFSKRRYADLVSIFIKPITDTLLSQFNINRWKIDKFSNATSIEKIINLDYYTASHILEMVLPASHYEEAMISDITEKNTYIVDDNMYRSAVLHSIVYPFTDDILVKVDRASMFYSLECRTPILDYRVMELALSVPTSYNFHNGVLKCPLKDILSHYVPKDIIERPKEGFGMPVNKWLHDELNEMTNDYLSETYIRRQGIFSENGMVNFVEQFNLMRSPILDRIAYTLLVFQLWWDTYECI